MFKAKKVENKYVLSLDNHVEVFKAFTKFVEENNIKSGTISGLGAVSEATLRFFDPKTKEYVDKTFNEQMEIANLTGNISTKDGAAYLHLHIVLGREDYTSLAGHLLSAKICGAGEFVVESFENCQIERTYCEEIGLNLYDFDKVIS